MCGICGKLQFDPAATVDPGLLARMMSRLAHRGPDGHGTYFDGPVALGHLRLSIIDIAGGAQPMGNEDGSVQVVFNGEIYNFAALREELQARGHVFRTHSDTEVIVHLYEEHGDDCVKRMTGMFAFALWDAKRRRLLLARDRMGIKPLYYAVTRRAIVFASELKALLEDPDVSRELHLPSIDRFLTYYYLPGETTLFRDIGKLPAGCCLSVQDGAAPRIQPYWDLRFTAAGAGRPQRGFDDAAHELRALLDRVVKEHMASDVPVGVLLSGGVDSSAILGFAAAHASTPVHSFTMGFAGRGVADERPFARLAAQRFGSRHHEISMSAEDFRDFLPRYVWHMEEPVCEPPAVGLHFVSRLAARASVKVLLSGEGGDEAFGGYPEYRNLLALERMKAAAGPLRGWLRHGFSALHRGGWERGRHYAGLVEPALADYYLSRTASPGNPFNSMKPALYRQAFASALEGHAPDEPTRSLWARMAGQGALSGMLYVDSKSWLVDDLLVKADKMTMAASVELRVPLLDHRVLEFAASLPSSFKVSGWSLKRILKKALEGTLPEPIVQRKKAGFPVPYAQWMRRELKDYVFDTVLAAGGICDAYFSRRTVAGLLEANQRTGRFPKEVFSLLVLELWHRQFAGAPAASPAAALPAAPAEALASPA